MKRFAILLGLYALAGCFPASATTKLRLHDSPSTINGCKTMDLSLGPPNQTAGFFTGVTTTVASGTNIQMTKTAGGTALCWASEPLAAGFTLQSTDGNVTFNVYGGESATTVNAAFRARVFRWTGSLSAAVVLGEMSTELTTTLTTVHNWTNATTANGFITTTTFNTGDRIVLELFDENCATSGCPTGTMAAGTTTASYDGNVDASTGSSWVQLAETVTFTPDGGSGGTPDVVQWVGTPNINNGGQTMAANATITVALPSLAQAGNWIGIFFWYQAGTVWSVTDDQGNAYAEGPECTESGNVTQGIMFYAQNVAANTRVLTVKHTTGTAQYFGAVAVEVKNIATSSSLDASSCGSSGAGSTAPAAGSMTPLTSGDFLIQFFANETNLGTSSITAGSQANITWGLLAADILDGDGAQYGTYTSTSAINPTMAQGSSLAWVSNAVALKASTAGAAAPAGMYIRGAQGMTFQTGTTSPQAMQFPTKGNLIVNVFGAGGGDHPTSMASSNSCSWAHTGTVVLDGVNNASEIWYCPNSTPSLAMTVTATMNQTAVGDDDQFLFDVVGANASPFGSNDVTGTGSKTGVSPVDPLTFTPLQSNSLVFANLIVTFNTVNAVTNTGCLLQNGFMSTNSTGNTPYYENNGWATCLDHAATGIAFDFTLQSGLGTNTSNWASRAAEFIPPSSGGGCTRSRLLLTGAGC